MNLRIAAVMAGLCATVMTAGCAASVAGQAQIAPGAVLANSSTSAPPPFPDTTATGSAATVTNPTDTTVDQVPQGTATPSTVGPGESGTTGGGGGDSTATNSTDPPNLTDLPTAPDLPTANSGDESVGPTSLPGIPGLSKDCNTVLAAITAFSSVLQGVQATATISQATVDEALKQLPASGLPDRPQADVDVLRATIAAAAGKSLADLGITLADGKVVTALKDLSGWAQSNCA